MKNKGMTLFIAVVVMGILLFISFAVVNITLKNTLFASSGRDSQFAFYAADAGLECALYWDAKFDSFATSTSGSPINCASNIMSNNSAISGTSTLTKIGGGGSANPISVFGVTMNMGSNSVSHCAIVTVIKNPNGTTYIKSRGYNTCASNPRRIERGVEVTY